MMTPTISIDLGASYTKVAYRGRLERSGNQGFASCDTEAVVLEKTTTVPSVVIRTDDRKRPWIMGVDAIGTTPAIGMKVFENWKSALYSSAFDAKKVELVLVAGAYFQWLLDGFDSAGIDVGKDNRVRVTIPALRRIEEQKEALIQCMKLNGWPENIEVVKEPVANIVGVLSGGRNVVSAWGKISYQPTFGRSPGSGLSQLDYVYEEARKHALGHRAERHLKLAVIDFGSFTLDFASLTLDLNIIEYEKFPVASLSPESWEIGVIDQIDRPCFEELFERHNLHRDRLSFGIKEEAKKALYAGEPYAVPYTGGLAKLGVTSSDKLCVETAISSYSLDAWSNIKERCRDAELVVLTGGGASIPAVRQFFTRRLKDLGVANVVEFTEVDHANAGRTGTDGPRNWRSVGEGLGRLATGLGGASIALGFGPDELCRR